MKTIELGASGLRTPPLIVGGNVFGWTVGEAESFAILDAFLDAGVTMIDTADIYWAFVPGNVGGESETILGAWMKARGNRDRVQIGTKVGLLAGEGGDKLQPARIRSGIEDSLRRLQTDYVDLYYAHWDDPDTPLGEVAATFDALVQEGKVRALGASNYTQDRLSQLVEITKANGFAPFSVYQPQFSLVEPEGFPEEYRTYCVEQDIVGLAAFGLASGFLTGKYRSRSDLEGRKRGSRVEKYFTAQGRAVLEALDAVSAETGAKPAQIALAWVAAQPGLGAPIASATSPAQVADLVGSLTVELTPEHLAMLTRASQMPADPVADF